MEVAVRILLAMTVWLTPLVLLVLSILRVYSRQTASRLLLGALASSFAGGVVALGFAYVLPAYESSKLFNSSMFQMDVTSIVQVLTSHWQADYRTTVHPLRPLLLQPISYLVLLLTNIGSHFRIAQITSAVCLSLSAALLAIALYGFTKNWSALVIGVSGYIFSFSYLLFSTFPESAGLAAPSVILPYAVYSLYRNDESFTKRERLLHYSVGVLSFGVTITNFVHSLIVYGFRVAKTSSQTGIKRKSVVIVLRYVVVTSLFTVCVSLAQRVLYSGSPYWFHPVSLLQEGVWLAIWWDGYLHPLRTLIQVLVYPIIGTQPVLSNLGMLLERHPIPMFSLESVGFLDTSLTFIALVLVLVILLVCAILKGNLSGLSMILFPPTIAIAFNLLLHSVYGNELILYSGYWLGAWWLVFTTLMCRMRSGLLFAGLFVAGIAINNTLVLSRLRTGMTQLSEYVSLQMPMGVPLVHEFARNYVNWAGYYSPGVGSKGVIVAVFDTNHGQSSLDSLVRKEKVEHRLLIEPIPSATITSVAGDFRVEQTWYAVRDGVIHRILIRSSANKNIAARVRVYLLAGDFGPAGSSLDRVYSWYEDTRSVVSSGKPVIRCLTTPDRVVYHHKRWKLYETMILGLDSVRSQPLRDALAAKIRRAEVSKNSNVLLIWNVPIQSGGEVDLWFHCPYTRMPLDASGKPLHEVANLPEYRPVSRNYGPLTRNEIESYLRQAEAFWKSIFGRYELFLPDSEWSEGFWGAAAHLIESVQQDGRIPVTPINYGVFTRDAAYMIYALLTAGQTDYARQATEYLLRNPWEGRPYPEGDTPGHILWTMHKYWRYSRDRQWLQQKVSQIVNLADGILQMRSDGLSPVTVEILGHRRTIPANASTALSLQQRAGRQQPFILNYGKMDQVGLLYVNSVSLFGLRGAIEMLRAANAGEAAAQIENRYSEYLQEFLALLKVLDYQLDYDERGHYFALWPAELHLYDPKVRDFFLQRAFKGKAVTSVWKYLDMDYAHNMLAAGRREAGHEVVERYFALPAFRSWKLLDEGGPSSEGYWKHLSNWLWDPQVAVPHGWSLASLCLLVRDCVVREEGNRLVLLSGVPSGWLADGQRVHFALPTEYGEVRVVCTGKADGIRLNVDMQTPPSGGIWLYLPDGFVHAKVRVPVGKEVFVARKQ